MSKTKDIIKDDRLITCACSEKYEEQKPSCCGNIYKLGKLIKEFDA